MYVNQTAKEVKRSRAVLCLPFLFVTVDVHFTEKGAGRGWADRIIDQQNRHDDTATYRDDIFGRVLIVWGSPLLSLSVGVMIC